MKMLRERKAKRLLRAHGSKVSNIFGIEKINKLVLESPCSIGPAQYAGGPEQVVKVGAHSYLRGGCLLGAVNEIGRYCSISTNVQLGQSRHGHPIEWVSTAPPLSAGYSADSQPCTIGNDVWIGAGAIISSGISIGNGAVVGQGSLVTRDVAPYEIVAGFPARKIKDRFEPDLVNELLQSRWWDYPLSALQQLDRQNPRHFLEQFMSQSLEPVDYPFIEICRDLSVKVGRL